MMIPMVKQVQGEREREGERDAPTYNFLNFFFIFILMESDFMLSAMLE